MDFLELAKARYSVRKYDPRPIAEDVLNRILEAGNVAPTGVNNQPQRIYVLRSEAALQKIAGLTRCTFGAPTVLIVCNDLTQEWNNPIEPGFSSGVQDVSIVATHIMLQAWEEGVGSCWVNLFSPTAVREAFDLPEHEVPVLLMPLGYPAADAAPSHRHAEHKPIGDTVTFL